MLRRTCPEFGPSPYHLNNRWSYSILRRDHNLGASIFGAASYGGAVAIGSLWLRPEKVIRAAIVPVEIISRATTIACSWLSWISWAAEQILSVWPTIRAIELWCCSSLSDTARNANEIRSPRSHRRTDFQHDGAPPRRKTHERQVT